MNVSSLPRALFWMMLAIGVYACQDLVIKSISSEVSLGQIVLVRSIVSLIPIFFIAWYTKIPLSLKTTHPFKHFFRASLAFIALLCFVYAFIHMPLAQAYTLTFTTPLFLTALSSVFLREKVGFYRWACVLLGFMGVLVVTRPDRHFIQGASLIALFGGITYAGSLLLIRDLSRSETYVTILFSFAVGSIFFSIPFALYNWPPLAFFHWESLFFIGLLGGMAQCLMTQAFRLAPASALAPFDYIALLWGLTFDYCLFQCIPTIAVFIGGGIIMCAGGLIFFHERKRLED